MRDLAMTPDDQQRYLDYARRSQSLVGLPTGRALDVLLRSAANEASLNGIGTLALSTELDHYLDVQHRFDGLEFHDHLGESRADVVIGGLPRTGTTLLHGLLGVSRDLSVPRSWQVQFPTTTSYSPSFIDNARRESQGRYDALTTLANRLSRMHPLDGDGAEECTPMLQHSLICLQNLIMFRIPSYFEWLLKQRLEPVYDFWQRQLRGIRSISSTDTLLLKSPLHFVGYEALLSSHRPRMLIHVRRPMRDTLDSFLQMVEATRAVFSDHPVDRCALVEEWAGYLEPLMMRAEIALVNNPDALRLVDYAELVGQPAIVAETLMGELGVDVPSRQQLADVAAQLGARHDYTRRPFGRLLDPALERLRHFSDGSFVR